MLEKIRSLEIELDLMRGELQAIRDKQREGDVPPARGEA
jgi:hypothetical protein